MIAAAGAVATPAPALATNLWAPPDVRSADPAPALLVNPGGVPGLWPGASTDVVLRVTNRSGVPVTTTSVSHLATVVTAAAGSCSTSNFSVQLSHVPPVRLAAGGSSRLVLPRALSMSGAAGDGCQGARVRISVRVNAVAVSPTRSP